MKVKTGVIHVPQIGQELHDATITIESKPDGTIELSDIRAEGTRGRITGKATAHLDGLRFEQRRRLVLHRQGPRRSRSRSRACPSATRAGTIKIAAEKDGQRDPRRRWASPTLHLDLPAETGARRPVARGQPAHQRLAPPRRRSTSRAPRTRSAWQLDLRCRPGRRRRAPASTSPSPGSKTSPAAVELTDTARVSGDIELLPRRHDRGAAEAVRDRRAGLVRLRAEDTGEPLPQRHARAGTARPTGRGLRRVRGHAPAHHLGRSSSSAPSRRLGQPQILAMLLGSGDSARRGRAADGAERRRSSSPAASRSSSPRSQLNAPALGDGVQGPLHPVRHQRRRHAPPRPGLQPSATSSTRRRATPTRPAPAASAPRPAADLGGNAAMQTQTVLSLDWRFLPNWLLRGTVDVGGEQPSSRPRSCSGSTVTERFPRLHLRASRALRSADAMTTALRWPPKRPRTSASSTASTRSWARSSRLTSTTISRRRRSPSASGRRRTSPRCGSRCRRASRPTCSPRR